MRARRDVVIAAAALTALVFTVFAQTALHPFVSYDDPHYVTQNPMVTKGLTGEGLLWAFRISVGNWHPVTWISHMADVEAFGMNAGAHHLVSVLVHDANTVLLFILLRSLTGAFWSSALVAALFGIHPLRVESVAWVAERKDVLSTLFMLLSMATWVGYLRRPQRRRLLGALGFFVLGLGAKPMVMTLPAVLLLLDWWPLGRFPSAPHYPARWLSLLPPRGLLLEKSPFILLSAASLATTVVAQTRGAVKYVNPDLPTRVANAAVSYVAYLVSFFCPTRLAVLYPYPSSGIPRWEVLAAGLLLVAATTAALLASRRMPHLVFGWFWYLGTLVPVIGLIQVGAQARADRYTYLPLVGITIALAWCLQGAAARAPRGRWVFGAAATFVVVALAGAAFAQTRFWRDGVTLYQHALDVTRDNALISYNLGTDLKGMGRNEEAAAAFEEVLRVDPRHANAYNSLGDISFKAGRYAAAAENFEQAVRWDPTNDVLRFNLGMALARQGRKDLALEQWRRLKTTDEKKAQRLHAEIAPGEPQGP